MPHRKLRIAWSLVWGIAVLLLIAIWIRSYWYVDLIVIGRSHSVAWRQGFIFFDPEISFRIGVTAPPTSSCGPVTTMSIWNLHNASVYRIIGRFIQIWLIAPLFIALAVAPWFHGRFSLRTLLVATTLFAILIGLGRWSATRYQQTLGGTKISSPPRAIVRSFP